MSNDNLILTEHAIKRHAKRLQKQMKNYSQDLSLGESQNLLSKILGFNDWNHLNTILKPAIEKHDEESNILKSKDKAQDDLKEQQNIFDHINLEQSLQILLGLINNKETNALTPKTTFLISALMPALIYMRDQKEILLDSECVSHYLVLDHIINIYKVRRDFPGHIRSGIHEYLYSLPFFSNSTLKQSQFTIEQHEAAQLPLFFILNQLKKIENNNFIIAEKHWFIRKQKLFNTTNCIYSPKFGKYQEPKNNTYLILNEKFHNFDFIEDSWIDMPEYEDFILSIEKNNQLKTVKVFDLILHISKIISPYKRNKMQLLLNSILENYSIATEISKQIQNYLNNYFNPTIENYEKDKKIIKELEIKPIVVVISSSKTVCKSAKLFLDKNEVAGEYYACKTFETIEEFLSYKKTEPKPPKFIICDENIELDNIHYPIIKLTEKCKDEIFYKTMSKLSFTKTKKLEVIKELKNYINENKGQVDSKYWKLLLRLYQEIFDKENFDYTSLNFSINFNLKEVFKFDNFSFTPEIEKNYFLSKPFTKEDLFKIISYVKIYD